MNTSLSATTRSFRAYSTNLRVEKGKIRSFSKVLHANERNQIDFRHEHQRSNSVDGNRTRISPPIARSNTNQPTTHSQTQRTLLGQKYNDQIRQVSCRTRY